MRSPLAAAQARLARCTDTGYPDGAAQTRGGSAYARPALFIFLLVALVWTWPIPAHLSTRIAHDPGDPVLNTWIIWWNAHAIPFTRAWWNPPIFSPMEGALALSEHLAGLGILTTPIQLAGGSPVLAYNVALIASYALSGWFAYLLVCRLTGSVLAAACGGMAFAVAPYRAGQLAHLQVLTSQWMPAMLLGLHAFLETGRRRWLALFGLAWLLQALSNGYFLLFFPALIVLWLAWFVDWSAARARGIAIFLAWVAASIPLLPVLFMYRRVQQGLGLVRRPGEIVLYSATFASFLHAPPLLRFWPAGPSTTQEEYLFPGLTVVLVLAAGLCLSLAARRAPTDAPPSGTRRSALVFYAGAALFFYACSLGPGADGSALAWLRPYRWLMELPGYDGLRVAARFAMLGVFCQSIAAGLVVARLGGAFPKAYPRARPDRAHGSDGGRLHPRAAARRPASAGADFRDSWTHPRASGRRRPRQCRGDVPIDHASGCRS